MGPDGAPQSCILVVERYGALYSLKYYIWGHNQIYGAQ